MSEKTKKKKNTRKKTVAKKSATKKTVAKKTTAKAAPKKVARKKTTSKRNKVNTLPYANVVSETKTPMGFEDINDAKYEKARVDIRFSKSQKDLFEYAARLGGFKTLTSFVIHSIERKAKMIIDDYNKVLASEKDREMFFNALLHPEKPNKNLINATKEYNKLIVNK